MTLGAQIRKARGNRFSIRGLARTIGVSHTYLSDVERGVKLPSDDVLDDLIDQLGLNRREVYLLRGTLTNKARRWLKKRSSTERVNKMAEKEEGS